MGEKMTRQEVERICKHVLHYTFVSETDGKGRGRGRGSKKWDRKNDVKELLCVVASQNLFHEFHPG